MPHLLLLALACNPPPTEPTASAEPLTAPVHEPWRRADVRPALDARLFERHPALADVSLFASQIQDGARPDAASRGVFGAGNGAAFALVGMTDPVNTLHALVGPFYRTQGRFFGDVAFTLEVDGWPYPFSNEHVARPRGTGLVVTRGDVGGWSMFTVDAPPRPAGVDPLDRPGVLLRHVVVRAAAEASDVVVRVDPFDEVVDVDGIPAVIIPDDDRHMGFVALGDVALDADLTLHLGPMRPGDERELVVALVFATSGPDLRAQADALASVDPEAWLGETLASWSGWAAARAQVAVDDPWFVDWLDGLDAMVEVQRGAWGGITPMSRYTGTWLRDTLAPVRFLSALGRHDEARAAVAYLHACHSLRGDIGNSCSSGLRPEQVPVEPDWAALPPMSGRTAAEGPSHLPLMARELVRWTGDRSLVDATWPWLRRSMSAQAVADGGLQPFSGDETFRLAMNAALGYPLEHPWEDLAWSLNSSFIYLAAADWLAAEAQRRGDTVADALRATRRDVDDGLAAFEQPDGGYAALIHRDPAEPVETRPFEDVNLAALWAGGLAPDDPRALANLAGLRAAVGHPDGSMQSPLAPVYDVPGMFLEGGAGTGMVPGYVLYNEAVTGSPWGPKAFGQLLVSSSPSGQYDEATRHSDRTAIMPLYDRGGTLGDVSARYRPWEGAINAEAALVWLLGRGPEEIGDGWVWHLAPRCPSGAPEVSWTGLTARGVQLDLRRAWDDGWTVEITARGGDAPVQLDVPLDRWSDIDVGIDGPSPGAVVVTPLGERVVRYDQRLISDGESVTYRVEPARAQDLQ